MRLDRQTGALEVGKQADIILVRGNDLNLSGAFDPLNAIVGFAHPGNVDTVFVAGRLHKQGGRMLRDDIPGLQAELAASGQRIFREFKAKAATAEFAEQPCVFSGPRLSGDTSLDVCVCGQPRRTAGPSRGLDGSLQLCPKTEDPVNCLPAPGQIADWLELLPAFADRHLLIVTDALVIAHGGRLSDIGGEPTTKK